MRLRAWCDGSAKQGCGGWAVFCETLDGRTFYFSGYAKSVTNNRMELQAVIEALIRTSELEPITIVCDSQYVIRGITIWIYGWHKSGWITSDGKPVANRDQWEFLLELSYGRDIRWQWVRGHSESRGNIEADRLALEARKRAEAL
jgi:ribonuclease HI